MLRGVLLALVVLASVPAFATAGAPLGADAATGTDGGGTAASDGGRSVEPLSRDATTAMTATTNTSAAANIVRDTELFLTPEEPGSYDAVVAYDFPESVSSVTVSIGSEATVTATSGFEEVDETTLEWTGDTRSPSFELRVQANETGDGRRADGLASADGLEGADGLAGANGLAGADRRALAAGPTDSTGVTGGETANGEWVFVDPGPWALVRAPRLGTDWRWRGSDDVGLESSVSVAGAGATGGEIAYFGPVTRYNASGRNERVELVVPDRASLNATPNAILASITDASERLRVGDRSREVFVVAAPSDVEWGVAGIQYGADDAWVDADEHVADADNVWLHEYVHTRQAFTTTESGRWVTEASAEYYAALLAFEQGLIPYRAFRSKLDDGKRSPYEDAVLAFPSTWSSGANYRKGALAVGALDRRLRASTDRRATFQSVFRELNDHTDDQNGSVSNADVLEAVESAGGSDVRERAVTLTESETTGETWSERTHGELFGSLPAVIEYEIVDGTLVADGEFGERELDGAAISLVAGESLHATVRASNVGWEPGEYATAMTVDGDVVAEREGELGANDSATVDFSHTFDETGTYDVTIGNRSITVTVREPATPTVSALEAPASADAGETFTVRVTLENTATVPGRVTLPFVLDDEELDEDTIVVPARSRFDREYSLSIPDAGEHTISVGNRTATVSIAGDAEPTGSPGTATAADGDGPVPTPGFGAAVAVAVVLALFTAVARGRRRP